MGEQTNLRRVAILEVLGVLEYQVAVCRKAEREWAEKYGAQSRGVATERSARMELELAIREIGRMASLQRRSREYRKEAAARAAFIAEAATRASQSPPADATREPS